MKKFRLIVCIGLSIVVLHFLAGSFGILPYSLLTATSLLVLNLVILLDLMVLVLLWRKPEVEGFVAVGILGIPMAALAAGLLGQLYGSLENLKFNDLTILALGFSLILSILFIKRAKGSVHFGARILFLLTMFSVVYTALKSTNILFDMSTSITESFIIKEKRQSNIQGHNYGFIIESKDFNKITIDKEIFNRFKVEDRLPLVFKKGAFNDPWIKEIL